MIRRVGKGVLMRHVVYFVLAPKANMVKIGQACEVDPPTARLKSLQTGSPEILQVILVLDYKPPFEENQLHFRFRDYREHGEWFRYEGELHKFIEIKKLNPAPTPEDDLALALPEGKEQITIDEQKRRKSQQRNEPLGTGSKLAPYASPAYGVVPAQVVYDEILDEYREKKNMNDIVITREWASVGIN
jgi:Meiotically Up-regulated Gene 113 (MUG113) protein